MFLWWRVHFLLSLRQTDESSSKGEPHSLTTKGKWYVLVEIKDLWSDCAARVRKNYFKQKSQSFSSTNFFSELRKYLNQRIDSCIWKKRSICLFLCILTPHNAFPERFVTLCWYINVRIFVFFLIPTSNLGTGTSRAFQLALNRFYI